MSIDHLRRYYRLPQRPATREATAEPQRVALTGMLEGTVMAIAGGGSFAVETHRPLDATHGRHSFERLPAIDGAALAPLARDPELAYLDIRRTVFLDTETTGLGMGTGTRVFLIGAGYLDGDVFRVRQFFLNAYGEEVHYLENFAAFLSNFSAIVSFNGKAFDWPLLESRYVYHRQFRRPPLLNPLHLDLLHPARRVWKARLESCALGSLERHVLNVGRTVEDVPGYLIPSLYFQYQRSGDGSLLTGVFYHNLLDVLSLAGLLIHFDALVQDPLGGLVDHPLDLFMVARALDRAADADRAASCYDEALRRGIEGPHRTDCLLALATLHKRQRWWEAATNVWYRLVDDGGAGAITGLIELAKYFEHVERDYAQAIDLVRQALTLVELSADRDAALWDELEHRLTRLMGRTRRTRSWAVSRA